jgi:hypothetical protein
MGKMLEKIYKIVEDKGGLPGRLKLAQATGITLQQAMDMKDKAAIIRHFKKTAAAILELDIDELLK